MASSTVIPEVGIGGLTDKIKWGGLKTALGDARGISPGDSPEQLNWITGRDKDYIALRRGQALLGKTRRIGGFTTGLGVSQLGPDQVPYYSANRSVYFYNSGIGDTQEVSVANLLPVAANGEDVSFLPYQNLAGSFMYVTSPHSGVYKIPVANGGSVVDQQINDFRFTYAKVDQNRVWGVARYGIRFAPDLTSLYISNVDKANYSNYGTPTVNELLAVGDGTGKTFSGTVTVAAPNTIFGVLVGAPIATGFSITNITTSGSIVTITAPGMTVANGDFLIVSGVTSTGDPINGNVLTVVQAGTGMFGVTPTAGISSITYGSGGTVYPAEAFVDQGTGVLTSNKGGTGTVNYATGVISLIFNTAPLAGSSIVANNFVENATSGGIWDFSFAASSPTIGQAYQLSQNAGGTAMAMAGFQSIEYVFHQNRSWNVTLPIDQTSAYTDVQNQEFWSHIGIPYPRAQFPTGDGVLFLDNTNPATPKMQILQIPPGSTSTTVVPTWISEDLDLADFGFSRAIVFRYGEYDILACEQQFDAQNLPYNTVFFVRNINSQLWNQLDYSVTSLGEFLGSLIGGDSLSPNVEVLFSGVDDDSTPISNKWTSGAYDFGFNGRKKVKILNVQGIIQREQNVNVSISLDQGAFAYAFTISGKGAYVSQTRVSLGGHTLGGAAVGGGEEIFGQTFSIDFPILTDYFDNIQVRFEATDIGAVQINRYAYKVVSLKSRKLSAPYEITPS